MVGDERNEAGEKKEGKTVLCFIQIINRMDPPKFDSLQQLDVNRVVVSLYGVDHVLHDLLYHRLIKKKSTGDFRIF